MAVGLGPTLRSVTGMRSHQAQSSAIVPSTEAFGRGIMGAVEITIGPREPQP